MVDLDRDQLYARGLSPQDVQHGHQQPEPDHPGRHRQDRRHGVLRQAQQQPGRRRRRSTTCPSRRSTACRSTSRTWPTCGRVRGADQRRPPRRAPGGADDDPQGRGGLHPQRGPARARGPAGHPGAAAAGAEDGTALRPVGLRPGGRRGGAQGGGDRRRADGPDDPAVPRLVAQHADRRHLDPAVDPDRRSSSCGRWASRSTS